MPRPDSPPHPSAAPEECGVSVPAGLVIGYRPAMRPVVRVASSDDAFCVGPGHHLLLARNGAGKTTLLRTLARLIRPVEGSLTASGAIYYFGDDLSFDSGHRPRAILRSLLDPGRYRVALSLAGELGLPLDRDYGKLSRGNRQKLGTILAEAAAHRREGGAILLLDEPLSGLDFVARDLVQSWWRERRSDVCRIVSHHPDSNLLEADSAIVIRGNSIALVEPTDGVFEWPALRDSLLDPSPAR